MSTVRVEASRQIPAPAERIWEIIVDYETEHLQILPKQYFKELTILEGGQGAGTRMHLVMTVLGQTSEMEMVASEPKSGRHLRERAIDGSVDTHFYLEPAGPHTHVTIATDFVVPKGPAGWIQRLILPAVTRRIYNDELALLAAYITKPSLA